MVDRRQFEPQLLGHLLSPGRRSRRPPLSSQRRLEPRSGRPRADHDMPRSRGTAATRSARRQNASRHVAPASGSAAAFRPRPHRSVGKAPPGIVTAQDAPPATLRPLPRKGGVRPFRPGDRARAGLRRPRRCRSPRHPPVRKGCAPRGCDRHATHRNRETSARRIPCTRNGTACRRTRPAADHDDVFHKHRQRAGESTYTNPMTGWRCAPATNRAAHRFLHQHLRIINKMIVMIREVVRRLQRLQYSAYRHVRP